MKEGEYESTSKSRRGTYISVMGIKKREKDAESEIERQRQR
jgi:hypothetical protein